MISSQKPWPLDNEAGPSFWNTVLCSEYQIMLKPNNPKHNVLSKNPQNLNFLLCILQNEENISALILQILKFLRAILERMSWHAEYSLY